MTEKNMNQTNNQFVHLNVKSEYSLLNSIAKVSDIIKEASRYQLPVIALTDLNNMYYAYHFQEKCRKSGVRPIIGITFCIRYSNAQIQDDKKTVPDYSYGNLTLLAVNQTGYKNLVCLSTLANKGEEHTGKDGFAYLESDILSQYSNGLICLTGGTSGIFFHDFDMNLPHLERLCKIYSSDNVYFEFQYHKSDDEYAFLMNDHIREVLSRMGIEAVATNDVYYMNQEHCYHRSLALEMNPNPNGIDKTSYAVDMNSEWYLKTPEEMCALFAPFLDKYPRILSNTVEIADRCKGEVPVEKALPQFPIPDGFSNVTYLRKLAYEGFDERFKNRKDIDLEEYKKRLEYELGIIEQMGFVDYHLITADFIQWAKDDKVFDHPRRYFPENVFPDLNKVPEKLWKKDYEILVGPGRGSAAGSLLCYCLKITNLDPIQDGLLFERFLNVERVSMPK